MIQSKNDLKEFLKYEKKLYIEDSWKVRVKHIILKNYNNYIWNYVYYLRKSEYFYNVKKGIIKAIGYTYYKQKKEKLGLKLGIQMHINNFDMGLKISHPFGIIINKNAKIGKNCTLRGSNCIGNDGVNNENFPILGDNVSLGYGAMVCGKVRLGNNVFIGANSLVNKSFDGDNIVLVGSPAKQIGK